MSVTLFAPANPGAFFGDYPGRQPRPPYVGGERASRLLPFFGFVTRARALNLRVPNLPAKIRDDEHGQDAAPRPEEFIGSHVLSPPAPGAIRVSRADAHFRHPHSAGPSLRRTADRHAAPILCVQLEKVATIGAASRGAHRPRLVMDSQPSAQQEKPAQARLGLPSFLAFWSQRNPFRKSFTKYTDPPGPPDFRTKLPYSKFTA